MGTIMRRPEPPTLGARDEQIHETLLRLEVDKGGLPAHEVVTDLPIRGAAEFRPRFAEDEHAVAGRARKARDRALDAGQDADHADDGRRVHGAGRALIVERDVAAGDGRIEHSTRVRNPARRLLKLIEHLGALGTAEVEAVGDAERLSARARDVARGFGHGCLAPLVGIEPHISAVAVGLDRDAERLVPDAQQARIAAWRYYRAGLNRRIVLLKHPLLAGN